MANFLIAQSKRNAAVKGAEVTAKRATISDVAKAAGVSVGTVSNVLNSPSSVRTDTRTAVEAAMTALSYHPHTSARTMSSIYRGRRPEKTCPRLVLAGYINVDYTAFVDVLPHREDRITASRIRKSLGGPAANVAVAAATLGGDLLLQVELASALGADADSEWALMELNRLGVHVAPMGISPRNRLSRCLIFVEPNGSRTIINEPLTLTLEDTRFPVSPTASKQPQCLHVEGFQVAGLNNLMQEFRKSGWRVTVHTAGLPAQLRNPAGLQHLCRSTDVLFLNRQLAHDLLPAAHQTGALVAEFGALLQAQSPERGHVVLTLDEDGLAIFPKGDAAPLRVSAPRVGVVDSTGAGDAVAGAFLGHWLHGEPLETCAIAALAAGTLSVTAQGAQGAPATMQDLRDFASDHQLQVWESPLDAWSKVS